MADNYLAGKFATVTVDNGAALAFDHWKLSIKNDLPKISNFTSQGFQALIAGFTSGTITLEGPYNEGNMPFTAGASVSVALGFTSILGITVTGLVESIEPDVKAEDAERLSVTIQSSGVFTAQIL